MFRSELILIVEDEPIVAMDLADAVTELGGRLVGPFATVWEALPSLDSHAISGAILDATLQDRDITPIARRLVEKGIPLVVYSGTGLPEELAAVHPGLTVIAKPATSPSVASRLAREMRLAQPGDIDLLK
jgi:CheY-like chemotaxis protein